MDAEGNTFSLLNDAKHTEVLKYAVNSEHNYSMHVLLMNKKKWDSLTPEQQKILREAAKEANDWQRKESVVLEEKAWQAFRDRGIKIHMLTDAERAELKAKTRPAYEKVRQGSAGRHPAASGRNPEVTLPDLSLLRAARPPQDSFLRLHRGLS